jgi:hypothetical protein
MTPLKIGQIWMNRGQNRRFLIREITTHSNRTVTLTVTTYDMYDGHQWPREQFSYCDQPDCWARTNRMSENYDLVTCLYEPST